MSCETYGYRVRTLAATDTKGTRYKVVNMATNTGSTYGHDHGADNPWIAALCEQIAAEHGPNRRRWNAAEILYVGNDSHGDKVYTVPIYS